MTASNLNDYRADHLFILIGTNPLPNYVAAKLLWRKAEKPEKSKLYFVYSRATDSARQALQSALGYEHEDPYIKNIEVEEANPTNVANKIADYATDLVGSVGLNYTGGTKVMAVHAYMALQKLHKLKVCYSYLDARTLRMIIQGSEIANMVNPMAELDTELTVDTMLALHGYQEPSLKREPIWPEAANALAQVHSSEYAQEIWHSWVRRSFLREPSWPVSVGATPPDRDQFWKNWARDTLLYHTPQLPRQAYNPRTWKNKDELTHTAFALPADPAEIAATDGHIRRAVAGRNLQTLEDVRQALNFKDAEKLGKWFEGEWLETYVLSQLRQLKNEDRTMHYHIGDIVRDIQAKRKVTLADAKRTQLKQELQLDVAFLRGYQLFVLSCTTALDKSLCKSKLLEAAVRAEQIGGAEARVGLICCFDNPQHLEKEIADVLGTRVKVFCRSELYGLKDHIAAWIDSVSA